MINEKIIRRIERLHKKEVPFIIVKYPLTFFGISNNVYDLLVIKGERVEIIPLDRDNVVAAISKLSLPVAYKRNSRNIIWGDGKFKEKYKTIKNKENDRTIFG